MATSIRSKILILFNTVTTGVQQLRIDKKYGKRKPFVILPQIECEGYLNDHQVCFRFCHNLIHKSAIFELIWQGPSLGNNVSSLSFQFNNGTTDVLGMQVYLNGTYSLSLLLTHLDYETAFACGNVSKEKFACNLFESKTPFLSYEEANVYLISDHSDLDASFSSQGYWRAVDESIVQIVEDFSIPAVQLHDNTRYVWQPFFHPHLNKLYAKWEAFDFNITSKVFLFGDSQTRSWKEYLEVVSGALN